LRPEGRLGIIVCMILRPGNRLGCAGSAVELLVVRAAPELDLDLRCDGEVMRTGPIGRSSIADRAGATPTEVGRRYRAAVVGLEVLCTKGGLGRLTLGDEPLTEDGGATATGDREPRVRPPDRDGDQLAIDPP
jgi:hypothetical protein